MLVDLKMLAGTKLKILNNEEIKNTIDITNIYSADQIINQKINNFAKQSN